MPRFSLAFMIGVIAVIAWEMACLVYASSRWAVSAVAGFYLALGAAVVVAILSPVRGRRAFSVGFTVWGLGYLAATAIPIDEPLRLVNEIVDGSYSIIIPESRRPIEGHRVYVPIQPSNLVDGQRTDNLGASVNVSWEGGKPLHAMPENPIDHEPGAPIQISGVILDMRPEAGALLTEAMAAGKKVKIEQTVGSHASLVDRGSFQRVGKGVLGMLLGLTGGVIGVLVAGRTGSTAARGTL